MRSLKEKAFLLLLPLIPALLLSSQASAAGRVAFVSWASGKSRELDSRWESITAGNRLKPVVIRRGYARQGRNRARSVSGPKWKNSASACTVTGFTGPGSGRMFSRVSRKRSGPTRGSFSFSNPASMNHGLSYNVRRPGGSSAHRWNSVSPQTISCSPSEKTRNVIAARASQTAPGFRRRQPCRKPRRPNATVTYPM